MVPVGAWLSWGLIAGRAFDACACRSGSTIPRQCPDRVTPPACRRSRIGRQSLATEKRHLSLPERSAYRRLEDVIGCKWSAGVVAAIGEGVHRPGELERYIPGISKKILNERLRKLLDFGIIIRRDFSGARPRVEYSLTRTGEKLSEILRRIRELSLEG